LIPTLFASSRETNKPSFDSDTPLPFSKSGVVIQGISPLENSGLFRTWDYEIADITDCSDIPIFWNHANFRLLIPFPHHTNPIFFRCSSTLLATSPHPASTAAGLRIAFLQRLHPVRQLLRHPLNLCLNAASALPALVIHTSVLISSSVSFGYWANTALSSASWASLRLSSLSLPGQTGQGIVAALPVPL
jgi:hypothetical protein